MRLPELAIRNHRFTDVVVAMLALLGLLSFLGMPRAEDPFFELPFASVVAVVPGADPVVIEQIVVDPLEEAFGEIEDLRTLETSIEDGVAFFQVEMLSGTSSDEVFDAVLQKVNEIEPELPDEVQSVEARRASLADVSVLQLALVRDDGRLDGLAELAEELERRLRPVPGVRQVDLWAYAERQVRIELAPERMRALGISVDEVARAVEAAGQTIPGGFVRNGVRRLNVRTSGDFESLEEIADTPVRVAGGAIVRVRDMAQVVWRTEDEEYRARVGGVPTVMLTLAQREGANVFRVLEGVLPIVDAFEAELPAGVRLLEVFDQSESVSSRVNGFFSSLLQGILLVGVVMYFFVGLRSAALVMITIPLAILLALAGLDATGYGLQQMSIVGLVIALGLLVDDAIVVVESIGRMRRLGYAPGDAAVLGARDVAWPSTSGTLTTILAFVPMIVIQSSTGDYIRSLPVTVVYALLASLALSLTLTPLLASRFLTQRSLTRALEARPDRPAPSWLERAFGAEGLLDGPLARATDRYGRVLESCLRHRWRTVVLGFATFPLAMALIPLVGVSLFPKAEKPQFLINVETPPGTSLDGTDAAVAYVEGLLSDIPQVVDYVASVGHDNPPVYYNITERQARSNIGQFLVELDAYASTPSVIGSLEPEFGRYPGARISVIEFENGPPVEAPIVFKVTGPELETLEALADRVEQVVRATPGTRNVRNPLGLSKSELEVVVDRDRLALLGLDPLVVDRTVRASLAGLEVGRFRAADGDESDIVLRFPFHGEAPELDDLERVTLSGRDGSAVPLAQVASLRLTPGTGRIDHYDEERVATITAYAQGDASVLALTQAIGAELDAMEWPDGYRWFPGGTFEEQQEGFAGMIRALAVAILGIFAVLVLQFRSFVQPLIIFASVPLAFVGSVLALLLTGHTFSFTAFIGLTSLVGIVVNNSIILVDYANRLSAEGMGVTEALVAAGKTRFQPIVLATLTTVGGLLPLTLTGSTMWSPLGWTIIGGLLTSTGLTLVLVPALYSLAAGLGGLTSELVLKPGPIPELPRHGSQA